MKKRDRVRKLKDEARNVTEELKETTASKAGRVRDASKEGWRCRLVDGRRGVKELLPEDQGRGLPCHRSRTGRLQEGISRRNSSSGTAEGRIQEGLGFDDFRCQRPALDHSGDVGQWPVNREINDLVQNVVKGSPTIYDKAMDAEFIATHIGGGQHRLFDGGHTIIGAFRAGQAASPDDSIIQEAHGNNAGASPGRKHAERTSAGELGLRDLSQGCRSA